MSLSMLGNDLLEDTTQSQSRPKRVLITGFGPFEGYTSNPSLNAVNSMDTKEIENTRKIMLWKEPIPVSYTDVNLIVPVLLTKFRPHLTIHVGLNEKVSCFVLEKRAKKNGYGRQTDNAKQYPATFRNPSHGPDFAVTSLDVTAICTEFNDSYSPGRELEAKPSDDAGRFLCEYIFYTSLTVRQSPTIFVHIPVTNETEEKKDPNKKYYTTKQIAQGLERILELCLNQLARKPNETRAAK